MGAGVTIAALGSALAYITKTLAAIHPVRVVLSLLAAALILVVPISIVAIVKLRRRDLSTILEGSGWAINARMRLTRRQSRHFTTKPGIPRRVNERG
jgi:sulfite exporter TauE/SafE